MSTETSVCCGCCVNSNWLNKEYTAEFKYWPPQPDSLYEQEKEILQLLGNAWNVFIMLGNRSGDDNSEFRDAIHRCQQLIALRVARRVNPEVWTQP